MALGRCAIGLIALIQPNRPVLRTSPCTDTTVCQSADLQLLATSAPHEKRNVLHRVERHADEQGPAVCWLVRAARAAQGASFQGRCGPAAHERRAGEDRHEHLHLPDHAAKAVELGACQAAPLLGKALVGQVFVIRRVAPHRHEQRCRPQAQRVGKGVGHEHEA